MTNPGQIKQARFNELMIKFQRETPFTGTIHEKLYEWKWIAMQFICIKKSGIQPHELKTMLSKADHYTLLEMAHIVSAIELRPAKDMELELDEFVECQEAIMLLREELNTVILPKQKELEEFVLKEFDDQEKARQAASESFSKKLGKEFAKKNKEKMKDVKRIEKEFNEAAESLSELKGKTIALSNEIGEA